MSLGDFGGARRLDVEQFADFVLDIGEPAPGAVAAFLGAGRFGAGLADGFERGARRLVGRGELGFALGQRSAAARRAAVAVSISPIRA